MSKVQDIEAEGIGYTALRSYSRNGSVLGKVFEDGLLGAPYGDNFAKGVTKKEWHENVRTDKDAAIHFNITGRGRNGFSFPKKEEIGTSRYSYPGKIFVLFNTNAYREFVPTRRGKPMQKSRKMRSLTDSASQIEERFPQDRYIDEPEVSEDLLEQEEWDENFGIKDGMPVPDQESGFILSYRVSSRFFQGLVLCPYRTRTESEVREEVKKIEFRNDQEWRDSISIIRDGRLEERNPENIQRQAEEAAVKMMIGCKDKLDRLVPIYDKQGNLLWPKQMSYEEVKEFVAQCDAKDSEN
jgi:hypothetical protein